MIDMIELCKTLRVLLVNRKGVTALEYGLIASLIAAAIVTAVTTLGTKLSSLFTTLAGSL